MKDLFSEDPTRFQKFQLSFDDLLFDFSKNRIDETTLSLLMDLAEETGLKDRIEAMFSGQRINRTEDRAVLHTALRNRSGTPVYLQSETDSSVHTDVMPDVLKVLHQMRDFTKQIHSGIRRGYTGKKLTNVVNIGIGGSDLGPKMVTAALKPFARSKMRAYFVSNVDPTDITETLSQLDPESTLIIIASKTFTTQETMMNAGTAKQWLLGAFGNEEASIAKHFIAVSTNRQAVQDFGIDPESSMFGFWDWVGGRYSLWSAIGMPIALNLGMVHFEDLLQGAHDVDCHFRETPFRENIPVVMALLGIWYHNFLGAQSHAILPYDQYLLHLSSYLQQADMESNGKSVDGDGNTLNYDSGPIIWGQPGTNGQHAFYQLIHQGTRLIPCDFLAPALPQNPSGNHHQTLIGNFLAQTEALMKGKTTEEVAEELKNEEMDSTQRKLLIASKTFEGNRPTNSFLYKELNPRTLGRLIAFYEHKIFVQGSIWGVNSYDQMGVELGKQMAKTINRELASGKEAHAHDSSTNGLIEHYRSFHPA